MTKLSARDRAEEAAAAIADFKGIDRPATARERALAKYAPPAEPRREPAPERRSSLHRGDLIRVPGVKGRVAVLGRDLTRIEYVRLNKDGEPTSRLGLHFYDFLNPPEVLGRFRDPARLPDVPSEAAGSDTGDNDAPTGAEGEATMATTVKRGGAKKATAKKGSTKTTAAKATTAKKSSAGRKPKFAPTKAEVTAIAQRLRDGAKMNEIKAEHGLSNGQPVRKALLEHGFDSKGNKNPEGKTARELAAERRAEAAKNPPAKKASGAKTAGKSKAAKAKAKAADPS